VDDKSFEIVFFSRRVGDSPIPGAGSYADNQVCKNLNEANIFSLTFLKSETWFYRTNQLNRQTM
jgi:hypothetical protein